MNLELNHLKICHLGNDLNHLQFKLHCPLRNINFNTGATNQSGLGPPVSDSVICNLRFWPPGGNKIYSKHLTVTKIH